MHELSIAQSLIELACQAARDEKSDSVTKLNIRVGVLCGVVEDALRFCFDLAAEGTECAGAKLAIEVAPLTVFCPSCDQAVPLENAYHFACPKCNTPTPQILSGQELDLLSIEITPAEIADDVPSCA